MHSDSGLTNSRSASHPTATLAAAWIAIGFDHQLLHAAGPVSIDLRCVASSSGHHSPVDHQEPVVASGDVALHQDVAAADLVGKPDGGPDLSLRLQIDTDTSPWLPASGLSTTGKPMSCAADQAPSSVRTASPRGTGTPTVCSMRLVRLLSWHRSTAIALVRVV